MGTVALAASRLPSRCSRMLAASGGSQPPIGALGAMPQSHAAATATHAKRAGSWMLPEAKGDDLLYAAQWDGAVLVFSYPALKGVGELTGFPIQTVFGLTRQATSGSLTHGMQNSWNMRMEATLR